MRTALALTPGLIALAVLGSAVGCGPTEGGSCTGNVYRCSGNNAVLECRSGRWVELPCSGPDGCSSVPGGIACDISGNQAGDDCPTALEGTGFCRGSPPSLFACQSSALVKIDDCSSCTVTASNIVCNP